MAIFGNKGLNTIQGNIGSRAIKMADIYIRSNTSDSGQVTDPAVYQNAIATYLAPYSNNPTVKDKIAEYANNAKSIATKNLDQNVTLAKFKQSLDSALFYKNDGARNPYALARATASTLNGALAGLDAQIQYLNSQNKSVDSLLTYRATLAEAARQENSLVNGLVNGTVNPQQDGYGYYVKTNPADDSLLGVALLPTGVSGLTETTKSMSRLDTTAQMGTGTATTSVPIYMTSTTDASGNKTAVLGNAQTGKQMTWSGSGTGGLSGDVDSLDLSTPDSTQQFPFQANASLKPGQIGQAISSVDNQGNPQYTYYYKGQDGSLNVISDPSVISKMKNDPILAKSANNPLYLTPDDVSSMGTTTPFGAPQLTALDQAAAAQPAAPQAAAEPAQPSLFSRFVGGVEKDAGDAVSAIGSGIGSLFRKFAGNKNNPAQPAQPAETVGGQPSAPDIVDKGAPIFNSAPGTQ